MTRPTNREWQQVTTKDSQKHRRNWRDCQTNIATKKTGGQTAHSQGSGDNNTVPRFRSRPPQSCIEEVCCVQVDLPRSTQDHKWCTYIPRTRQSRSDQPATLSHNHTQMHSVSTITHSAHSPSRVHCSTSCGALSHDSAVSCCFGKPIAVCDVNVGTSFTHCLSVYVVSLTLRLNKGEIQRTD